MKKHKSIDDIALREKLMEIKQLKDIRFASIMYHAFIEYYINELICLKFTDAKLIIDSNEIGTFFNKYLILNALEIFKKKDKLKENINHITKIRNHYAHNLITDEALPDNIKNHIEQLTIFNVYNFKIIDSISTKNIRKEYELKFCLSAISTIFFLHKIVRVNKDLEEWADNKNSKAIQKIRPKKHRQLSEQTSPK